MSVGSSVTTSPREDESVSPPRRRAVPAWLPPGVLALAWLAVLLAHLRTPAPSDQLNYMTAAAHFPGPVEGTTEIHQVTRYGLVLPVRLAITVFGYSQAAYAIVPVMAALALLLGTYALGTLLFSRTAGVAGALITASATPVFRYSTDLLPDVLATAQFTCALALAVFVARRPDAPGRLPLLAVGLLLGWSYMTREFVVFMWPVVLVLLYRRARLTGLLWAAVPVLSCVAVELTLCWRLYGDPFARMLAIVGHGQGASTPEIAATYRDKPRMEYVMRLPDTLSEYPEGGLFVVLLCLTLLGGVLFLRRTAVPVAAFASLWVPLTLLGGVIDPAAPSLRLQLIRYWIPLFPAIVLGGVGLLWLGAVFLARRTPAGARTRFAAAAVAVLATAAVVSGTAARHWWAEPVTRAGGATQMEALRSWLSGHGGASPRIWTDLRSGRVLEVYRQGPWGGRAWPARIETIRPGEGTPRPGDLQLRFDADTGDVCPYCHAAAQTAFKEPIWRDPGWRRVFSTPDHVVVVYRLVQEAPPRPPSGRADASDGGDGESGRRGAVPVQATAPAAGTS
ncbi:hypothetical protein E1281_17545 [Actinomadura sp. KC345]|uniref:ArnT family glycosyltransferase n=1 Tax=Actinomadura sp. KC345 TaxID=2530371 RepID=UPI0010524CB5|nr:glycosyltransferase family 39 protein [Actinomadura sp. KC345]TDC53513.1 hypothetical protein E1281_17545 [Actinomadura sp. KC345]